MSVEEDLDILEERIKEFRKKGEDEEIISIFENYVTYLKNTGYEEFKLNGTGFEKLPPYMKEHKYN